MRKIKHLFLQLETGFGVVLLLFMMGCCKLDKKIKVHIVQDPTNYKPMVVFSYYIDSKGTEIKHGEYYKFHYFGDGSLDEIRRIEFNDGDKIYEEATSFESTRVAIGVQANSMMENKANTGAGKEK